MRVGLHMQIYEIGECTCSTNRQAIQKFRRRSSGVCLQGKRQADPSERRQFPRYSFTGTFEATEPNSETRIHGRTADLSEGGCYADTMSPLPAGTVVKVRISKENRSFESQATVAYAVAGMGMGLRFESTDPQQVANLRRWLGELRGEFPMDKEAENEEPRACAVAVKQVRLERSDWGADAQGGARPFHGERDAAKAGLTKRPAKMTGTSRRRPERPRSGAAAPFHPHNNQPDTPQERKPCRGLLGWENSS